MDMKRKKNINETRISKGFSDKPERTIKIGPSTGYDTCTERLPAASTFWRYADRLGMNQANCHLRSMAEMRERLWQQCHLKYQKVYVSLDTSVKTLYGEQQGGRKGYNPRNPGKKGIVLFLALSMKAANIYRANCSKEKHCAERRPGF